MTRRAAAAKKGALALGLGVFLAAPTGAGGERHPIGSLLERYAEAGHFSGCALVARGDRVLYRGAHGLANREWRIPHTPDTRFMVGSLSKAFTATVVLQLVQEGRLSLDARLSDQLPEFPRPRGERITVRHLLTHTSGLGNHGDLDGFESRLERLPHTPAELAVLIGSQEPRSEPGERFAYSSFGYDLLAFICERLEGRRFADVLRDRIFAPAAMGHTSLFDNLTLLERRAAGYEYDLVPGFENATFVDATNVVGGGGILSTVDDLHRWVRALSGGRLLASSWIDEMQRSQVTPGAGAGYGYGWFVREPLAGRGREAWHTGSTNGFTSLISWRPGADDLVVLLSNVRSNVLGGRQRYRLATLEEDIRSVLAGEPAKPVKRSAVVAISPLTVAAGGTAGVEAFRRLRREEPTAYYFDELELNALGLQLLFRQQRIQDALAILALNIEQHPGSYNVYDTMGYVLRRQGRAEDAVDCYRRGIEVFRSDPGANEAYRADFEKALRLVADSPGGPRAPRCGP